MTLNVPADEKREVFEKLKAELQRAFSTPDDQFVEVDAEAVIARNLARLRK